MTVAANAVECIDCSNITMLGDVMHDECPQCGNDNLTPVMVTPCPAEHPADCEDGDHHFGIKKHVTPTST